MSLKQIKQLMTEESKPKGPSKVEATEDDNFDQSDSYDSQDEEGDEEVEKDQEQVYERQDLFVIFTGERELKNIDQVRVKISQFTGVVIRTKTVGEITMQNLVQALCQDSAIFQLQIRNHQPSGKIQAHKVDMQSDLDASFDFLGKKLSTQPLSGIVNLRFEDCKFSSKAVTVLKTFLVQNSFIDTLVVSKVEFENSTPDFKELCNGIQQNKKLRKVGFTAMYFDEEQYGKIMCRLLNDCNSLREFDCSYSEFYHPKVFFEMCQAFIGENCRVDVLKIKGLQITSLEAKVIQFVLMKNKRLQTIDISNCRAQQSANFDLFLQKIDKQSPIRCLVLDNMFPDLSASLEVLGEALSTNTQVECLIMRENRLKWIPYAAFFESLKINTSLKKINISKTELNDRVLEPLCSLLCNPDVVLVDLDLSRNLISDVGLTALGTALLNNKTIKYLNLAQNTFKDVGLKKFVQYLSNSNCSLQELSLMGNKINNDGIKTFSEFIKANTSLQTLDLGRNMFGELGFRYFAQQMGAECNLIYLDISKNKELQDEGSLVILAQKLAHNRHLQTLDLSGLRISKPFLKQYFEPALKKNCTLKFVIGNLTPDIIDFDLRVNIQIQQEIEPNFSSVSQALGPNTFNTSEVDPMHTTSLNMRNKDPLLFEATLKFMRHKDIRQIDFSSMQLLDSHLYQLAQYLLESNTNNLRSLYIDDNNFITDDGLSRMAEALEQNNKLAHFSFKDCASLTNEGLKNLNQVVRMKNTVIQTIEFTEQNFEESLGKSVKLETSLNMAIQLYLRPTFKSVKQAQNKNKILSNEVEFDVDAPIVEYFGAVIKCLRIKRPSIIQIQDKNLSDKEVIELCNFLKDQNMITKLNLRKNNITNAGAKAISDWISEHDSTLTSIDLSRNKITRQGGEDLLSVLKKLTRIQDFQIAYGNPVPLTLHLAIDSEIQANNQIKSNSLDSRKQMLKTRKDRLRYELIDKGPIYMRCALKSVELLKIIHLSLPDNMIGFEEAKMIASMIQQNPPLRTLNLEMNNLDAECAKLIAQALKSNSNLAVLNISSNKLADLGVSYLFGPLIKACVANKRAVQTNLDFDSTNTKRDQNAAAQEVMSPTQRVPSLKLSTPVSVPTPTHLSKSYLTTEEIQMPQLSQLKVINIKHNMITLESYKAIWTLLDINPDVVIYFDSESAIRVQNLKEQNAKVQIPADNNFDDLSASVAQADPNSDYNFKLRTEQAEGDQNDGQGDLEQKNLLEVAPALQRKQHVFIRKFGLILMTLCCYPKDEDQYKDGKMPSLLKVIAAPLSNSQRKALMFKPNLEKYLRLDNRTLQSTNRWFIVLLQTGMICCIIIPIILAKETAGAFLALYAGLMLSGELIFILSSLFAIKISIFNLYLYIQLLSGILRKASLLALAFLAGICIRSQSLVGIIIGVIAIISLLSEQTLILGQIKRTWIIDTDAVLPHIESTQRVAKILHFKALNLVYKKVTLLPSIQSLQLSEAIAQDLNPDLIKPKPKGIFNRFKHFFALSNESNDLGRHLILINLPLLILLVIAFIAKITVLDIMFLVAAAIFVIDSGVCLLQNAEIEKWDTVDSDFVYDTSMQRIQQKSVRYLEVLNRADPFTNTQMLTENSIESQTETEDDNQSNKTKKSNINFGEENIFNPGNTLDTKQNPDQIDSNFLPSPTDNELLVPV